MKASSSIVSLVMVIGAVFAAENAGAATALRQLAQHPGAICQPFKNADGLHLRRRPKSLQNDGGTPAVVTCSFTTKGDWSANYSENPKYFFIYASANDGVDDAISCSAVLGHLDQASPPVVVVKTAALPKAGFERAMSWNASDFGASNTLPSGLISVSCILNPGVGIDDSYVYFNENLDPD